MRAGACQSSGVRIPYNFMPDEDDLSDIQDRDLSFTSQAGHVISI